MERGDDQVLEVPYTGVPSSCDQLGFTTCHTRQNMPLMLPYAYRKALKPLETLGTALNTLNSAPQDLQEAS